MNSSLPDQKRKQNLTLALVLGALALVMLFASLPMWKALFGSVSGAG